MRAALIPAFGRRPTMAATDRPVPGDDEVLIEVEAAAINPLDFHIASGDWYGIRPDPPYIPGREGVGRIVGPHEDAGRRVYFRYGRRAGGSLAELATSARGEMAPVPDGIDAGLAAAIGVPGTAAWLALTERGGLAAGERVAVLGATGAVGRLAVQLAAAHGAEVVVAVSRDAVLPSKGAVRRVGLADLDDAADGESLVRMADAISAAAGGEIDLVIDTVWGRPARAAMLAMARDGRLVNIGSSGEPEIAMSSAQLRGRSLSVLGYTNAIYTDRLSSVYQTLAEFALDGVIELPVESYSLDDVGEAWMRAARPPRVKVVVRP